MLSNSGTCSYNGITFAALYHSRVMTRPIEDEAGRTTVGVEHTILIDGYVAGTSPSTDSNLTSMRRLLTTPGGYLQYNDKGFGTLTVNPPGGGGVRDARWGPHPRLHSFQPVGNDQAAHITWEVVTVIPECIGARYEREIMAMNYDVDFQIDRHGLTTITIGGYLEIPMTRISVDDRRLPDNVDSYRERLENLPAAGFQRTSQRFHVSKDKRRLDFSWTDTELPQAFPDRVAHIEARQEVSSNLAALGWRTWYINLEATISTPQGAPKRAALDAYLALAGSRLRNLQPLGFGSVQHRRLVDLRISDDIYSLSTHFSSRWAVVTLSDIGAFLAASGLWTPIEGSAHLRWKASLADYNTQGVRGWAQGESRKEDEVIIDLCLRGPPKPPTRYKTGTPGNTPTTPGSTPTSPKRPTRNPKGTPLDPPPQPTPSQSWMYYEVSLEYLEEPARTFRKTLPVRPTDTPGSAGFSPTPRPPEPGDIGLRSSGSAEAFDFKAVDNSLPPKANPWGGLPPAPNQRPPEVMQEHGSPTRYVVLTGYGVRLGQPVPAPCLVEVGGVAAVEVDRRVVSAILAQWDGVPVHMTTWRITYRLPDAPTGVVPVLANPVLDLGG